MRRRVGVVLAGGAGRRMGRTKGDLVRDGSALATRAALALAEHCHPVLISIAPGAANPAPGFAAIEDEPPGGRGPLSGIAAGFRAAEGADLLVLACDYPHVSAGFLGALVAADASGAEVVFPRDAAERDHPLVGLWRASAAAAVNVALAGGDYRVAALLRSLRVVRLDAAAFPDTDLARELFNWNRPEDLGRSD